MTPAATKISKGAVFAIFRRTARSCAAPFACATAHRSPKLADSVTAVDVAVCAGAITEDPSMAMRSLTHKALVRAGPGWPRAQKSRNSEYI